MLTQTQPLTITKSNTTPVQILQDHFSSSLKKVDDIISCYLQSPIPLISEIATHLIKAGGKRLRPLLTLATANLFNPLCSQSLYLAAAIEFIHTATLLHDDVIDLSDLRRGRKTANYLWGNQASILVGDFLFAQSFNLMIKCNHIETLSILSKASATIAEGEVFQLSVLNNLALSLEDYLKVIGAKTAELFAAACQAGACLAGAPSDISQDLYHYGYKIGLAFQLIDVILDYTASSHIMGKQPGDDFREGKITLPVLFTLEACPPEHLSFWERTLVKEEQTSEDFAQALQHIHTYNGFKRTYSIAQSYTQDALAHLDKLPSSFLKTCLKDIALDTLNRQW